VDVILDLMIHDIDLSMFLNGAIIDIRATGYIENQRIVFALAHLRHENGCTSRLQASSITQKKMRLIQATSKDSFIQCDLLRKEVVISRESELKKNELNSYTISANEEHIQVPQMEALQMELIDFIDNVALKRLNEGLTPTLKSGVDTIQVAKKISNLIKEN
jgi:predicted dehydrogenase